MSQPLVSVIIPAYNAQATLKECIESVLKQTLADLEIIIVNDGSTDHTLEICESYAPRDKRVKIINKENGGVSSARNEGIRHATAPFVQFVDSDDRLVHTMCEIMYRKAITEKSDLVMCEYFAVKGEEVSYRQMLPNSVNIHQAADFAELFQQYQVNQLWNKLYKRELLTMSFRVGINAGEDLLFNMQYFSKVKSVGVVNEALYLYTLDSKNRIVSNSFISLNTVYESVYQFAENYVENGGKLSGLIDLRYVEEYTYFLKLMSRIRNVNCDMNNGRRMARKIGTRCRGKSIKGFCFWLIVMLKLERLVVLLYRIGA